jgi:hypothetical protein
VAAGAALSLAQGRACGRHGHRAPHPQHAVFLGHRQRSQAQATGAPSISRATLPSFGYILFPRLAALQCLRLTKRFSNQLSLPIPNSSPTTVSPPTKQMTPTPSGACRIARHSPPSHSPPSHSSHSSHSLAAALLAAGNGNRRRRSTRKMGPTCEINTIYLVK